MDAAQDEPVVSIEIHGTTVVIDGVVVEHDGSRSPHEVAVVTAATRVAQPLQRPVRALALDDLGRTSMVIHPDARVTDVRTLEHLHDSGEVPLVVAGPETPDDAAPRPPEVVVPDRHEVPAEKGPDRATPPAAAPAVATAPVAPAPPEPVPAAAASSATPVPPPSPAPTVAEGSGASGTPRRSLPTTPLERPLLPSTPPPSNGSHAGPSSARSAVTTLEPGLGGVTSSTSDASPSTPGPTPPVDRPLRRAGTADTPDIPDSADSAEAQGADPVPAASRHAPAAPRVASEPVPAAEPERPRPTREPASSADHVEPTPAGADVGGAASPSTSASSSTSSSTTVVASATPSSEGETRASRRAAVESRSFLTRTTDVEAARKGYRGWLTRLGLHAGPSPSELAQRDDVRAVSRHWPGPRTIAVVNAKGGSGKTPTTALLSALFATHGGSGVLAWDNAEVRGTLGWRTEQGPHEAHVFDLLPVADRLLEPTARAADLAAYVHHQTADKYEVLRSNPTMLATPRRLTALDFDAVHRVASKYFRLIVVDSGDDETGPHWLRMIDHTDQLVVVTTTRPDHAESARLLLEALRVRDDHSRRLADEAVVIVSQADRDEASAASIAAGFNGLARVAVTIPYDRALRASWLRFDRMEPATRRAYLHAAAEVSNGL